MIDMEFFARAGSDPGLSACRKRSFRQAGQFCEELCSNEGSHLRAKREREMNSIFPGGTLTVPAEPWFCPLPSSPRVFHQ